MLTLLRFRLGENESQEEKTKEMDLAFQFVKTIPL